MILVDTSIWIDHLRVPQEELIRLLETDDVATHPMVRGELALGSLRHRTRLLKVLAELPGLLVSEHEEVLGLVERARLYARGLNLVDVHLLSSVLITPDARILTRDRRLREVATELGIAA